MKSIEVLAIIAIGCVLTIPSLAAAEPAPVENDNGTQPTIFQAVSTQSDTLNSTSQVEENLEGFEGSLSDRNTFVVEDNTGDVFINHIVEDKDLSLVDTDVKVIDTYEFTYQGQTFQNRIVQD